MTPPAKTPDVKTLEYQPEVDTSPHVETIAAILLAGEIFKKSVKDNELVAVVNRNCNAAKLIKQYFKENQ